MKLKMMQVIRGRHDARQAWVDSGGDIDVAKALLNQRYAAAGIDPATIMLLIQLALKLWQFWKDTHQSEPSVVISADEPIEDYQ